LEPGPRTPVLSCSHSPMNQAAQKTVLVSVQNLHKNYGDLAAVRGLSFDIFQGEVFGLLGPNGAGKTTTIEIIEGLIP